MAIFEGIGRALTSIGSDMQRNRLEREKREEFFADRTDQRAYAEEIRDQQAQIRADETRANRDWSRRQQDAQNLYTEGVTQANRDAAVTEFDRQAGVRAYAAEAAGGRAARVLAEGRVYDENQRQEGVDAMARIAETSPTGSRPAGEPMGIPFRDPDALWPTAAPGDRALMQRERLTFPTTGQPSAGQANAVRGNVAAAGEVVDEEGRVIDFRWNPYQIEQRSQAVLRGDDPGDWPDPYVAEPTFEPELIDTPGPRGWWQRTLPWGETGSEISTPPPSTAMAPQEGAGQRQRIGAGGEVAPPGIDPEEYRRMLDSGATPARIQQWIAREAARRGR